MKKTKEKRKTRTIILTTVEMLLKEATYIHEEAFSIEICPEVDSKEDDEIASELTSSEVIVGHKFSLGNDAVKLFSNIYFSRGILDEEDPGRRKWTAIDFRKVMKQKKEKGLKRNLYY